MKKILLFICLAVFSYSLFSQTGPGWIQQRAKNNFRDSVNFVQPIKINGTVLTANGLELNLLDGALFNLAEINRIVGVTSSVQDQLNAKVNAFNGSLTGTTNIAKLKLGGNNAATLDTVKQVGSTLQIFVGADTNSVYVPVSNRRQYSDILLKKYTDINSQTGSNYTLVLTDAGKLITVDHADADTIIVPLNATVAFPVGTQINVVGVGVGLTFFKPYNGTVVINSADAKVTQRLRYSVVTLIKRLENTWLLIGDIN